MMICYYPNLDLHFITEVTYCVQRVLVVIDGFPAYEEIVIEIGF